MRLLLRRTTYEEQFIWIIAGIEVSTGVQRVFYANMEYGALKTPPKLGWAISQDGTQPPPRFSVHKTRWWDVDRPALCHEQRGVGVMRSRKGSFFSS